MSTTIRIVNPLGGARRHEPVTFSVAGDVQGATWWATTETGERLPCQRLKSGTVHGRTSFVTIVDIDGAIELTLDRACSADEAADVGGLRELPARERDAFVRLDTGAFDLELCRGTAEGLGSSKWGLRHFRGLDDNFELLPSGNNAIGGFYGPFFTPENGLINPPEHTVVDIDILEKGPLFHHYRMRGVVPDGLLDELKGKAFAIDWKFYYRANWFERRYVVDDFQTVINGRSVTNKITVGDEFEGGKGQLVFDRFAAYGGTRYRGGDPYAGELAAMVAETLRDLGEAGAKFEEFRAELKDIGSAHWDLYWRMFCAWEKVLPEHELRQRLGRVMSASHVKADLPQRQWTIEQQPVDVSAVPHETIFAGPASKTVEFHSPSGRAMVWWTSQPSGAFQIVQRPQSGWVNWGTNGENECPELPVGVTIRTAYGPFAADWQVVADRLERPVVAIPD